MKYSDFTIRARDWQEGAFKVEVPEQMREAETVNYDEAKLRRPLRNLERKQMNLSDLIALGEALAQLLLTSQVRQLLLMSLARLSTEESLRVRLVLNDPRIAELPWEYLYLSLAGGEKGLDGFLALNPQTSLVRYEALPNSATQITAQAPLRVLAGFAAPHELEELELETEREAIEQALQATPGVQLDFIEHLTRPQLEAKLPGAHLFHFAGHGLFAASETEVAGTRNLTTGKSADETTLAPAAAGLGVLALEDEQGGIERFAADRLDLLLRGANTRVAVLGACETGRRDGLNVWSGIAPALMRAGLAGVVGMQYKVYNKAALHFARRFYQTLAAGLSLDEAVLQGRLAVINLGSPFEVDFGVPVLYLRAADSVVFPELGHDAAMNTTRAELNLVIEQRVEKLRGSKLIGLDVEVMESGNANVNQVADEVTDSEMIGGKFGRVG